MVELSQELKGALESDDSGPLESIAERGAPEDFETLAALVRDEATSERYRRRATSALGRWPDREDQAVDAIESALVGRTELERIAAIDALGRIGTPAAREAILQHLDDEPDVRRTAVTALARIGDDPAIEAVQELAEDDAEIVRDKARAVLDEGDVF